jgi:hypothetical protein
MYYKKEKTRKSKELRIMTRRQEERYNYNSSMSDKGSRIIFLLLTLKEVDHGAI